MRLDYKDVFPEGMEEYLSFNGWHFNKKMCDWASSKMYRKTSNNQKERITPYTKQSVTDLMKRCGITDLDANGYDDVYIANMCKADFWGTSIIDEQHLARFIKDYLCDPDGYEEVAFTRFYADCIGKGIIIPWEDLI